ncbi:hypothetical protein GTQ99_16690 [Kineococcus sp. T13]|uniref:hypothetical protein n=1 Tax=Kineococcus vitellinus TaxID=2696565 RepID=UPI00141376CD|nr:hypothetical protein [Kineococcus vitellinus]NAZ77047.1 hypothetical protein [Kineococcus vitellinus]
MSSPPHLRSTPAPRGGPAGSSWLTAVLDRGADPDPALPWRPRGAGERAWTDRDVRDGLLRRVVGDVVVGADVPLELPVRARALALLVPAGAVVLAGAAAWVHAGAPLPAPAQLLVGGVRLPPGAGTGLPLTASRVRPDERDVVAVAGLLLTAPARTLLDVARTSPHQAGRVREALQAAGLLDADALAEAAGRARGRAHVRTARDVLRLAGPAAPLRASAAGARP